jgi:hypothetical protein
MGLPAPTIGSTEYRLLGHVVSKTLGRFSFPIPIEGAHQRFQVKRKKITPARPTPATYYGIFSFGTWRMVTTIAPDCSMRCSSNTAVASLIGTRNRAVWEMG